MNDKEILNRIREAIACLDEAANRLPVVERGDRLLHTRLQDAGDRLVEVREEIQVRIEVQENARKALANL